ncbi:MAG: FGGY-family carbohydrate kinase [Chloroflexota bacterium]
MTRPVALGFDVGTSAVKAGLLRLDTDEPLMAVSHPYPSTRPWPGWVEQDPEHWLEGMARCWADLQAIAGPVELRSVGVCSQVNTHVFVDEELAPVRPAITWQDTRAAEVAAELDAAADDRREELWGGPFTIDASFPLARLRWLERAHPRQRSTTRWLLLPKDFCIARLTGEIVTDPLSPVGLVGGDVRYRAGVLELVEGAADLLPPLRAPDEAAGTTAPGNAVGLPGGLPVATSTMDAWGSIFGAGLVQPGRALDLAGTSEVVAVASDSATPVPGIVSFPPVGGLMVHAGPTQAGGSALDWVAGLLSCSVPEALAAAEVASREPQPIVFLPHLDGERAPYWNPDARGVFLGLTTETGPGHLALAVLEGVAHAVRMVLDGCEAAAQREVPAVRLAGGGARSRLWNQLKADAVSRPVEVLATLEAGVLGATLLGMVAAGLGPDVPTLAEDLVHVADRLEPRPSMVSRMDDLHGVYAAGYRALEPLFARLSAV